MVRRGYRRSGQYPDGTKCLYLVLEGGDEVPPSRINGASGRIIGLAGLRMQLTVPSSLVVDWMPVCP
jgi:hypothetical protein